MTTENYYIGISHVIHITTDDRTACEHCTVKFNQDKIAESINHYLTQHDYKLLHIGTETTRDPQESKVWHNTVALLGK